MSAFSACTVLCGSASKRKGKLAERARKAAHILWYLVLSLVIAFLALTAHYTFILDNISKSPFIYSFLVLAVLALLGVRFFMVNGKSPVSAWCCSALFIVALTLFAVLGMFPNIIISSHAPDTVSLFSSVLPASD